MLIFSSITCSHGVFVDLAHHKKWRVKTDKIFCITQPPHLQHGGGRVCRQEGITMTSSLLIRPDTGDLTSHN